MIMGIDIGNTNIKIGIFEGEEDSSGNNEFKLITGFKLTTTHNLTSDELGIRIKSILRDNINRINPYKMNGVICSSVVPQLNHTLFNMSKRYLGHTPYFVTCESNLGINIAYKDPYEIGADRLVNAVGVKKNYSSSAVIIDFGTATTFCALSKTKGYLGGVIVPGILISLDALFRKTAKLPQIELIKPNKVIGNSTRMGMVSGAYHSAIGTVEKITALIKKEIGENEIKVVATGGLANFISRGTDIIDIVDPLITLKGMLEIYKLNKENVLNIKE